MVRNMYIAMLAAILLVTGFVNKPETVSGEKIAGPTQTTGGKGGKIIRVTNLNSTGQGSLAEAIATTGPRLVVFEVGGVLDLKGITLTLNEPFLTIAGQTAPSPGVTLINGGISVKSHDIILQHIRVRTGTGKRSEGDLDALSTNGAHDVIIDHCTFSWAVDENCSVSGPRFEGSTPDEWRSNTTHRVTISNNIISEALSESIHSKGEHSKGTLVHDNASDILIYRNLYASNKDRNALFKGGARAVFANNYIYNPGVLALHYAMVSSQWKGKELQAGKLSIQGNVLQAGPDTENLSFLYAVDYGPYQIFMEDNLAHDAAGNPIPMYKGNAAALVKEKPIWFDGLEISKAADVKESIIKNVGARPWDRDAHDQRVIREMQAGTGKIIDAENEVGGYPAQKETREKFNEKEWNLVTMTRKNSQLK